MKPAAGRVNPIVVCHAGLPLKATKVSQRRFVILRLLSRDDTIKPSVELLMRKPEEIVIAVGQYTEFEGGSPQSRQFSFDVRKRPNLPQDSAMICCCSCARLMPHELAARCSVVARTLR